MTMEILKKSNLSVLVAMVLLLCFPTPGAADTPLPIRYWQLIDEARYIYRFDLERFNWRQIRTIREENRTAGQATKHFTMDQLPASMAIAQADSFQAQTKDKAMVLIRDPNGITMELPPMPAGENNVSLPADNNLIGRYLLGARVPLGAGDVDGDGATESVILCAKHLVSHFKNGGRMGSASVVYFDDTEKMPLEIGPVINTAKSKFGGGTQRPHRDYKMMVKYAGRPLAGGRVTVVAIGSQWQKTVVTDENGIFEIMPTDDRSIQREWQKYLYTATHLDREKAAFYIATLPTVVYKNRPEWRSKTMGFAFWSIIGTGVTLLMVFGLYRRRRKRDNQALTVFDSRKPER